MTCAVYAPAVISSKELRDWLKPLIKGNQEDLAETWKLAQPTISRINTQPTYDFPLDTVAKIARGMGFEDLSAFFRHVELGVKPATRSLRAVQEGDLVVAPTAVAPSERASDADTMRRLGIAFLAASAHALEATGTAPTVRRPRGRKPKVGR